MGWLGDPCRGDGLQVLAKSLVRDVVFRLVLRWVLLCDVGKLGFLWVRGWSFLLLLFILFLIFFLFFPFPFFFRLGLRCLTLEGWLLALGRFRGLGWRLSWRLLSLAILLGCLFGGLKNIRLSEVITARVELIVVVLVLAHTQPLCDVHVAWRWQGHTDWGERLP